MDIFRISLRHCGPRPPSLRAPTTVIAGPAHRHCGPRPPSLRAPPTVIAGPDPQSLEARDLGSGPG